VEDRKNKRREIRSFVALDIPAEAKQYLKNLIESRIHALEGARWIRPEQMHFTLKFFPSFPLERLVEMRGLFSTLSGSFSPITVVLENMGVFPSPSKARVLWVGTDSLSARTLCSLANTLENACERLGFMKEKRPFVPHITIARFRNPRAVPPNILHMDNSCETIVHRLVFYQSTLTPSGAMYHPLCEYSLE